MIGYRSTSSLVDLHRGYQLVSNLTNYYPDFSDWYWNKLAPSVMLGDGRAVLAECDHEVIGIALARRGADPKLRCLRVVPSYHNRGVGLHLMDHTLRAIDCDRPAATVPEELMHDFARMFVNRYGFSLDHVDRGLYRLGKLEYQFNSVDNHRIKSDY